MGAPLRVLIGCESSGAVRRAFLARGHDAYSCDLLRADDGETKRHIHGDLLAQLGGGWDVLIAHPSCTYLTNSAAWAFTDGPYHQKVKPGTLVGAERRAAREDALRFVGALMAAPIGRIAIENPIGCISSRIRKPDQIIHPHQFGDDASKATCLWLKNLPVLVPTERVPPRWVCCKKRLLPVRAGLSVCPSCLGKRKPAPRWANQTDSGQNRLPPTADRWKIRSATYQGIANAMAHSWGGEVN